ncbi:hypothetical protein SAMN04487996_10741 [Dyadobacter soli]|uniref:TraB family protein n=1 Tax=Dyadobacter soli TaxID=659014 RepID=A0A1G7FXD0_9BACT|nr:TraB/GumN family protein [Dyadobacter soli]SDE80462.1 hypothetical protein SAMN04487996_10741 [Dyadobacter soli]
MKPTFRIYLAIILVQTVASLAQAQSQKSATGPDPRTILWKITGPRYTKPSYLLGTFHLSDAEWLLKKPEMSKVIDSTEYILNEAFSTQPAVAVKKKYVLKALPLLDPKQFQTLDSFFVARVGEGIRNNPDAEAMTVAEMGSIIMETLVSGSDKPNAITKFIDKDLFDLYIKLGRQGDQLDRMKVVDFDSSEIDHARQYMARAMHYIVGSDKPDWNPYHMTDLEGSLANYKAMKVEYHLDGYSKDTNTITYFDFIPLDQRNKDWMPKITATISTKPTLIAVGLGHLYYQTGLIVLLRKQGYRVEPVLFN